MSVESSRTNYARGALEESSVDPDPLRQLRRWLDDAYAKPEVLEPNAMCVATATCDGAPSARVVLLRGVDERGLVFYTSYLSRKGRELSENPRIAATFFWPALERQVRIEGSVAALTEDESDAYFASRPRGHCLSAWASEQSEPIDVRATLDERLEHFAQRFEGEPVPRPHSWGGYRIAPAVVEFWQGRPNRLHDRLRYRREQGRWSIERLQP